MATFLHFSLSSLVTGIQEGRGERWGRKGKESIKYFQTVIIVMTITNRTDYNREDKTITNFVYRTSEDGFFG